MRAVISLRNRSTTFNENSIGNCIIGPVGVDYGDSTVSLLANLNECLDRYARPKNRAEFTATLTELANDGYAVSQAHPGQYSFGPVAHVFFWGLEMLCEV